MPLREREEGGTMQRWVGGWRRGRMYGDARRACVQVRARKRGVFY